VGDWFLRIDDDDAVVSLFSKVKGAEGSKRVNKTHVQFCTTRALAYRYVEEGTLQYSCMRAASSTGSIVDD
jgi:hypothetical protein